MLLREFIDKNVQYYQKFMDHLEVQSILTNL